MPNDPWAQISEPSGIGVAARRVEANHPFNFYWARSRDGRCLLVLEYSNNVSVQDRRPKLAEIRIDERRIVDEPARFVLELTRDENRQIFYQLCLDIIESTKHCSDERSALATLIRRTWRWHEMLKGSRDERLSPNAQKGLIGELRILELALLPKFRAGDAVAFWRGPEGAPKDFCVGAIAIEAKAKLGVARPFVSITSEYQLDTDSLDALYLAITSVDAGSRDMSGAHTLTQYVSHITGLIEASDPGALGHFESKLYEAGYISEHDYSDNYWVLGRTRWYRVIEQFPRIVPSHLSPAISKLEYELRIAGLDEWETCIEDFHEMLGDRQE